MISVLAIVYIYIVASFFFFNQKTVYSRRISDWSSEFALPISRASGAAAALPGRSRMGVDRGGAGHAGAGRALRAGLVARAEASGRRQVPDPLSPAARRGATTDRGAARNPRRGQHHLFHPTEPRQSRLPHRPRQIGRAHV